MSEEKIQIIYAPGTFGHCVRWMFDRFTKGSKFKDIDSPWDRDDRVHGFDQSSFNVKFTRAHQLNVGVVSPDPDANKVILNFPPRDLIFAERCEFYRNPGCENEEGRYKNIIDRENASFVRGSFGCVRYSKNVAKELLKIRFHDMENHAWWNNMKKFSVDENHHQFNLCSLWDQTLLKDELTKVSERYSLDFNIDEKVIYNVVEKIKNLHVVITKDRAHEILEAIDSKNNVNCNELDIMEQAYIEAELEKRHDLILFPYGSNWFETTDQINDFLDTYPKYLKHMNPRLSWYNNIKNPFHLKDGCTK